MLLILAAMIDWHSGWTMMDGKHTRYGVEWLLEKWKTFRSSTVLLEGKIRPFFVYTHNVYPATCTVRSALSWRLRLKLFHCYRIVIMLFDHDRANVYVCALRSDAYRHSVFSRGFCFSYSFL